MKLSILLAGALASVTLAHSSHEGPSMPKLLGARRLLSTLKARNALPEVLAEQMGGIEKREDSHDLENLETRQVGGTSGTCGPGVASCSSGICCSPAGYVTFGKW